jgi:hypothetical protein
VEVALVAQSCTESKDPDWRDFDLVELYVDILVKNEGRLPVTIYRDLIRLRAEDGVRSRTLTWAAAEPMSVAPGSTSKIVVRYMNRGSLSCSGTLAVDFDKSIVQGGRPLRLAPIEFVASR